MDFTASKAKVADWLNRSDLTSQIGDFINIAQRNLERENNWNAMKQRKTLSATSEAYITLPDRIKEVRWLKYFWNDRYWDLDFKSPQTALALFPYPSSQTSRPKVYAFLEEQNEILIRPSPDQAYAYDMGIYAYTADLSAGADHNWWTDNAWELLLFAALIAAEPFIKDDPRIPVWQAMYEKLKSNLQSAEDKASSAGGPLVIVSNLPAQLSGGGSFDIDIIE